MLCVHSKKHMNDDPALKSAKMKQNLNTVKEMGKLLKKGGMLIWIAPAGGRDRRNTETGELVPDKFDPQAVAMMTKLGTKKTAAKTHFYPMAMATYDIMPPPASKEKALGEVRIVNYTGAGLSLGEEIDVTAETGVWAKGLKEDDDEAQALTDFIWDKVRTAWVVQ